MKDSSRPQIGLEDVERLRKGLEDEEERKRLERLQKARRWPGNDSPKTGLVDATPTEQNDT